VGTEAGGSRKETKPVPPRFRLKFICAYGLIAIALADVAGATTVRVFTGDVPVVLGDVAKFAVAALGAGLAMGMRPSAEEKEPTREDLER
jgi:hypothetical protein